MNICLCLALCLVAIEDGCVQRAAAQSCDSYDTCKNLAAQGVKGTGFFVNESYIVTSFHVVHFCSDISIKGESINTIASIITEDEHNDLAILKSSNTVAQSLALRDSPSIFAGENVLSVSYNDGILQIKPTKVIHPNIDYMSMRNSDTVAKKIKLIEASKSGDSGSPIIDHSGNVIGVNSASLEMTAASVDTRTAYDIAVHLAHVKELLDKAKVTYKTTNSKARLTQEVIDNAVEMAVVEVYCVHGG